MRVERLAIIGCGLMGGSFALALRSLDLVGTVAGYSASANTRATALALGVTGVLLVLAGAIAMATKKIHIGPGVTHPAVRHLTVTASAMGSNRPGFDFGAAIFMAAGTAM